MIIWAVVIVYVICSAGGLLLIKNGLNAHQGTMGFAWQFDNLFRLFADEKILSGFLLYVLGFGIWLYMISRYELSLAFPVASGALYLGILVGSVFWLEEQVGLVRAAGTFLILAGIVLVSRS